MKEASNIVQASATYFRILYDDIAHKRLLSPVVGPANDERIKLTSKGIAHAEIKFGLSPGSLEFDDRFLVGDNYDGAESIVDRLIGNYQRGLTPEVAAEYNPTRFGGDDVEHFHEGNLPAVNANKYNPRFSVEDIKEFNGEGIPPEYANPFDERFKVPHIIKIKNLGHNSVIANNHDERLGGPNIVFLLENDIKPGKANEVSYPHTQDRYHIEGRLARISDGMVYHAIDSIDMYPCVIKTVTSSSQRELEYRQIILEQNILSQLNHPNIIRFRGKFIVDRGTTDHIPPGRQCIVMDYAEEDISALLNGGEDFMETLSKTMHSLASVIEYIVDVHGIANCDISPRNLLSHNGALNVIDFDLSREVWQTLPEGERGGPILYAAPELNELWKEREVTSTSDVYSVGLLTILFAYLHKESNGTCNNFEDDGEVFDLPSRSMSTNHLKSILQERQKQLVDLLDKSHLPSELSELILGSISYNHEDRPSPKEFQEGLGKLV